MSKRKWFWVILGIIVLIIFMSVVPKRKDLSLSPLRIMLPGTNPISTEDMIPNTDDSWTQKVLDRMRTPRGPGEIVPWQKAECNNDNRGVVYSCDGDIGTVCICDVSPCQKLEITCEPGSCSETMDACTHYRNTQS